MNSGSSADSPERIGVIVHVERNEVVDVIRKDIPLLDGYRREELVSAEAYEHVVAERDELRRAVNDNDRVRAARYRKALDDLEDKAHRHSTYGRAMNAAEVRHEILDVLSEVDQVADDTMIVVLSDDVACVLGRLVAVSGLARVSVGGPDAVEAFERLRDAVGMSAVIGAGVDESLLLKSVAAGGVQDRQWRFIGEDDCGPAEEVDRDVGNWTTEGDARRIARLMATADVPFDRVYLETRVVSYGAVTRVDFDLNDSEAQDG